MMAAAVDTHNGSVDTVDWFRVSKISKHDVSSREGLVTTVFRPRRKGLENRLKIDLLRYR
jgi:hypothetical protein